MLVKPGRTRAKARDYELAGTKGIILSIWFRISTTLSATVVGTVA
jgi:hypothetical protein